MELATLFVQYIYLQMVQNGDHKCTKKPETQIADEKTISEDETVYLKVLLDL
jgi:hypothetical protein